MGKVIMSGVSKGMSAPVGLPANFADATWAQIIKACETNTVPATWEVGDQKAMTINGTDYPIDIIGKNHDEYSDGSGTAPLTFQMHNYYSSTYAINSSNTNSGGWTDCTMRNVALPAILTLMPSEVQAGIKEVNKLTSIGGGSSTINTTADRLFLLSGDELRGSTSYSVAGEGAQYNYYSSGNSSAKVTIAGNSTAGWTRSPLKTTNVNWCHIYTDGSVGNTDASSKYSVAFAFCF